LDRLFNKKWGNMNWTLSALQGLWNFFVAWADAINEYRSQKANDKYYWGTYGIFCNRTSRNLYQNIVDCGRWNSLIRGFNYGNTDEGFSQ
jgi:hypothetical protein